MAKVPTLKRLSPEDFPKIDRKFLDSLNQYIEASYTNLNAGLTIKENFNGQISTVTVEKGMTVSSSAPLKFSWTKADAPVAILIGKISKSDSVVTGATYAPQIEWYYDSTNKQVCIVKIYGITNPDTSYSYSLTLVGFTG